MVRSSERQETSDLTTLYIRHNSTGVQKGHISVALLHPD